MEDLPRENLRPTPRALYSTLPIAICKALIEGFSTNNRKRHPSWANKEHIINGDDGRIIAPVHVRLITIGASHYCEKARWALDLAEADPTSPYYYTEDAHPPVFHGIATLNASRGKVSMTPMVVFKGPDIGEVIDKGNDIIMHDSGNIVKYFCPDLYPQPLESEIKELEGYIGSHLGATSRCYIYHQMLQPQYYEFLSNMMNQNSSSIEKFLWSKLLGKGIANGMRNAMKIDHNSAQVSLETIRTIFREMSEKLDDDDHNQTKEYLMDTKNHKYGFTAADLTLAALGAPLIGPPELEPFLKIDDEAALPKPLVDLKYELRETLAGQHILKMYKRHRVDRRLGPSSYGSISSSHNDQIRMVTPKIVGRRKLPSRTLALTLGATLSVGALLQSKL